MYSIIAFHYISRSNIVLSVIFAFLSSIDMLMAVQQHHNGMKVNWCQNEAHFCVVESKWKVTTKYNSSANSKPKNEFEQQEKDQNQPPNEECRRPPSWFAFRSRPSSREELIVTQFYNTGNLVGWLTDVFFYKARFFPFAWHRKPVPLTLEFY